ncbi:MAG: SCO family protein [Sphingobium sp.]
MAGCAMNRLLLCAMALAVMGSLSGCGGVAPADQQQGSLVGDAIGGSFTLTDQDGRTVSWDDFRGKYRIVYFGYTNCPDVCPVDLQRIMQGLRLLEKSAPARAAQIQPIFITVDPKRDTPPVMKAYVSALHPRLLGLTGTPEQIAAVARKFVVAYFLEKPNETGAYIVSHSRTPYLFGPDGKPIALVPVDDPASPAQEGGPTEVAAFLDNWVK